MSRFEESMTTKRILVIYCDEPGCDQYIYIHIDNTETALKKLLDDGWYVFEDGQNFYQYCNQHGSERKP